MNLSSLGPLEWGSIAPYLDRVLDLPSGEREAWLAQLATTQPAIAHTLREMLAELDAANAVGFLQDPLPDFLKLAAGAPSSMTGRCVGAYTIERLLGRGGLGEVWLASRNDARFRGRCAIRLFDGTRAGPGPTEHFRREGRLLACLTHPNIARLIDADITQDDRQFVAIEYIEGERIDRYCASKRLSVMARVRLFLDVVSAVAHAHANFVIHRELKPSNVFVTAAGVVKLLDTGFVRLLGLDQACDDARAPLERCTLTPEYAAPEQLLGEMPSTATDVYQLGMLLYVLLAGRHPLRASADRAERIKAVLEERVPWASDIADPRLHRELRGDLDAVLAMALRKQQSERYSTAAALHEELVRFLNREPVIARQGATFYRAGRFVARHTLLVAGVSLIVAGLCGALVFR